MSVLSGDYTGCSVLIYDGSDNHVGSSEAISYDRDTLRMRVQDLPSSFKTGDSCRVLILSSPKLCEYQATIVTEGAVKYIAMFKGREAERREAIRHKLTAPATITKLIYNGKPYLLHTPVKVEMINISTGGVRFRAPFFTITEGDRFQLHLKIGGVMKALIADVVNQMDGSSVLADYGCCFVNIAD